MTTYARSCWILPVFRTCCGCPWWWPSACCWCWANCCWCWTGGCCCCCCICGWCNCCCCCGGCCCCCCTGTCWYCTCCCCWTRKSLIGFLNRTSVLNNNLHIAGVVRRVLRESVAGIAEAVVAVDGVAALAEALVAIERKKNIRISS